MNPWRGLFDGAFDAVEATVNLIERTHQDELLRWKRRLGVLKPVKVVVDPVTGAHHLISSGVFETIRAVNDMIYMTSNIGVDILERYFQAHNALKSATPLQSNKTWSTNWVLDSIQASLNGLYGDAFFERKHRLDLGMSIRQQGGVVPLTAESLAELFPNSTPKLVVFVHALCTTEWVWSIGSQQHYGLPEVTIGTRLKDDLGYTPVYVRYNTGRHISHNGQLLSKHLSKLCTSFPVPLEQIALIGHSMGGLVARSAAHYGSKQHEPWVKYLRHIICIGSPHLGAPLEKAVNLLERFLRQIDAVGAQIPAELLQGRSAGIKDLRHGYIVDEEWMHQSPNQAVNDARQPVPLLDGVTYSSIASTITQDIKNPAGWLFGDLLVRTPSASGMTPKYERRIPFHHSTVLSGINHIRLANHPHVYDEVRRQLIAKPD